MARAFLVGLAALVCAALPPAPASATLIGDEIQGCLKNPGQCQTSFTAGVWLALDATVADPGIEYLRENLGPETLSADFTADTLTIARNATSGASFSALEWDFRDLDWSGGGGAITNVILLGTTGSLSVTDISFTSDSIRITTAAFVAGAGLHSASFQIVPEPAAALLLLAAAAAIRIGRRSR
jgi:hypothetical protein